MKTLIILLVFFASGHSLLQADQTLPPPTPYEVIKTGANHKVWQRETFERAPDGRIVSRPHQCIELASGMNYVNAQGQLVAAQETIEPCSAGATARQGAFQVIFANNLNSYGAIDMQTPDGKRLRSNILGLGYYDRATGRAVLIAQIQDCNGVLASDNQVLYPNAFQGFRADVRYTYKKGSFEQDVILREQPPAPESFGLNSQTTVLEVLTEFLNPPAETVTQSTDDVGQTTDEIVSWGAMKIGHGQAFDLVREDPTAMISMEKRYVTLQGRKILLEMVPMKVVAPSLNGLPPQASAPLPASNLKMARVDALPAVRKGELKSNPMKLALNTPATKGFVLDYVTLYASQTNSTFQGDSTYYISGDVSISGNTVIEGGAVIKFDTSTPSSINILGKVSCETGPYRPAVFTSANDSAAGEDVPPSGGSGGSSACTGSFTLHLENNTAQDWHYMYGGYDDTWNYFVLNEGSYIFPSSSSQDYTYTTGLGQYNFIEVFDEDWNEYYLDFYPTLTSGTVMVASDGSVSYTETGSPLCTLVTNPPSTVVGLALANGGNLHDLRFKNLTVGISSAGNYAITNVQFVNCDVGTKSQEASIYAGNILFSKVGTAFYGQTFNGTAENITFDQGNHLTDDASGSGVGCSFSLVNSLLTSVTDEGTVSVIKSFVQEPTSATGVYQMAGAASYYLADNTYRNQGTFSVNAGLLAELRRSTTYPPMIYSNQTITPTSPFVPQAQRDTDAPDLGYHYSPLDYCFGGVDATTNLTFTAGTAVGWFQLPGSGGPGYGLKLPNGTESQLNGTASQPCFVVRYITVQEGNGLWEDSGWLAGIISDANYNPSSMPVVKANFTKFSHLSGGPGHFRDYYQTLNMVANHSEFYNNFGGYVLDLFFTNCLLHRVNYWQGNADPAYSFETYRDIFKNCTFFKGGLEFAHWESAPNWRVLIQNCAFDETAINLDAGSQGWTWLTSDYNATNIEATYGSIKLPGSHNVAPSGSYDWQSSWFGNFYLPTNSALINAGNTNANLLGLYHFTTQTNQIKEAKSKVDIGYHYVALNAEGCPIDSTKNGVPDYEKDANGNGVPDGGELLWGIPSDAIKLWLKADTEINIGVSNQVSSWIDQSGNQNDATQDVEYRRPYYVTNSVNALPAIWFSGTNSSLEANSFLKLPNSVLSGVSGAEAFVVLKTATAFPSERHSLWKFGGAPLTSKAFPDVNGSISDDFGSSSLHSFTNPSCPLTEYNIYQVASQSGDWRSWLNGLIQVHTTNNTVLFPTTSGDTSLGWYALGAAPYYTGTVSLPCYFSGSVAEVLVYGRGLSDVERTNVNGYLARKYGLVPTTAMTSPTNGLIFATGSNIRLAADANEAGGGIIKQVEFFQNSTSLGICSNAPYSMIWSNVANGVANRTTYSLFVKATGLNGLIATSSIVSIMVDDPPTISITNPVSNMHFGIAPVSLEIKTTVSSYFGINNVKFYQGTNLLNTDFISPYSTSWTNVPAGVYGLSAIVQANDGLMATNSVFNVNIDPDTNGNGLSDYQDYLFGLNPIWAEQWKIWVGNPENH
jgi:hypothetical protein